MNWRALVLGASAMVVCLSGEAAGSEYRLEAAATSRDAVWTIVPTIAGPAGIPLRYEFMATKSGRSGRSVSVQRGILTIGSEGFRALAKLSIGLGTEDRCEVDIRVLDGTNLVASLSLHLPH